MPANNGSSLKREHTHFIGEKDRACFSGGETGCAQWNTEQWNGMIRYVNI